MRKAFLLAGLVLGLAAAARGAGPPEDFFATYNQLAILVDQPEATALDVARGSLLASRFFAVGADGLPSAQRWFGGARTRGHATMSGLFLALHGSSNHLAGVRRELETSRSKRTWVYELVGTEQRVRAALEQGDTWAPLLRILPSTAGCRRLAGMCAESRDPLTRRAGLYWGYWFADATYWRKVRQAASGDRDAVTRRVADLLLRAGKADAEAE